MNLFELSSEYIALKNMRFEDEQQQHDFEVILDTIKDNAFHKITNIGKLIKNIDAESAIIADEIKRLQARKKAHENKVERLKDYVYRAMGMLNTKKVEDTIMPVSIRKSPASANIIDEVAIDKKYLIEQQPKIDKKAILQDLKKGVSVVGAELIDDKEYVKIG